MQNKQLRGDENRANNTVIRKRAKAQIAVSSVKGEVREGKWLCVPYAAQGTQIWPQRAAVCSKGTARGCVARPVGLALEIIPAGWCLCTGYVVDSPAWWATTRQGIAAGRAGASHTTDSCHLGTWEHHPLLTDVQETSARGSSAGTKMGHH